LCKICIIVPRPLRPDSPSRRLSESQQDMTIEAKVCSIVPSALAKSLSYSFVPIR